MPSDLLGTIWDWFGRKKQITVTVVLDPGRQDTLIRNKDIMEIKLERPIKPGFRRKFKIKSDEPLDKGENGHYLQFEMVKGTARPPTIDQEAESESTIWLYGDGAIGENRVLVTADGHVGDGKAVIQLLVIWDVLHPDATELTGEVLLFQDEAIATEQPPAENPNGEQPAQ